MRQILNDQLEPSERASISLAYRQVKAAMSENALKNINGRMLELHAGLHDKPILLAMDQSARTTWEGAITPHVGDVPFSMSGQGQQAAIKISMAMSRHSTRAAYVLIEEPENHLSHTTLTQLLSRIDMLAGEDQQLFISTHSSYVLNRLGLDSVQLLGGQLPRKLSSLAPETVSYFRRLPGYDTLRMVLARKVVLVEGPSDEIIFERIFKDMFGRVPMELGIDVLSVRGLSFPRCLELCAALDKTVAAIRDNDGMSPYEIRSRLEQWLADGKREIFIGTFEAGNTLEPQLISHNEDSVLRRVLKLSTTTDLNLWMSREKTEAALRIALSDERLTPPGYIKDAASFING